MLVAPGPRVCTAAPRAAVRTGNAASLSQAGALDPAGAEVGDEGGEDVSEVLRRRRRDKDLPRCGWERVGGIAVENLHRLFLRRALDRLQAGANPGELRRWVRPRRRWRQADGFHGRVL